MPGLILSAPCSGSGKTTATLGALRALRRRGAAARGAKSGPDYIDPRFHEAACGAPCLNLDAWAMAPGRLAALAAAGPSDALLLVEGAMGLFDGAPPDGRGSTADLARMLGLPVILVVDAAAMAQSVAPLLDGFARHDPEVEVAGAILNRVAGARHEAALRRAAERAGVPVLGALPRDEGLARPSRHLGLVQAGEAPDLDAFLERAAERVAGGVDLDGLAGLARPLRAPPDAGAGAGGVAPPAQRIAAARDEAFGFLYPHLLADWRARGAEIAFFSPLAGDPVPEADLVFLPGGYPELHAGRLAQSGFPGALRARARTAGVYGECGGYMVMGDGLVDAAGARHAMAGLLRLETSFEAPRLRLGYRRLEAREGPFRGGFNGHEFHYAATLREEGTPLFDAADAEGRALAPMGLAEGRAWGSFAHLIDAAPPPASPHAPPPAPPRTSPPTSPPTSPRAFPRAAAGSMGGQ